LCFFDLQSPPDIHFDTPFRTIRSHVPIPALQEFAETAGERRQVYLKPPQPGTDDAVLRHLFTSLLPILAQPEEGNSLFIDHIALALQAYLLQAYATSAIRDRTARRGLAPWQERRAKETMNANLDRDVSIADLARELGLSTSHFARAFRLATGCPPHRWLLERRIESAQRLLLNSTMTLQEIASACGFTDQSTFTRAFTRMVGTSPAAWRRLRQG
jgi:AraC-like DNA-binding protein